jgi:exocyst complex component 3
MLYLDFYALYRAYPDVPLPYIEKILSKRDDLDKSQLNEMMETVKLKMKEDRPEQSESSPFSLLSK